MAKLSVIRTGGKQYMVKQDEEIIVDLLANKENEELEVETLAHVDTESNEIDLGKPNLEKKTKVKIIAHLKGEKLRIGKFKAKSRYRRVVGFRSKLSKIKVISI